MIELITIKAGELKPGHMLALFNSANPAQPRRHEVTGISRSVQGENRLMVIHVSGTKIPVRVYESDFVRIFV